MKNRAVKTHFWLSEHKFEIVYKSVRCGCKLFLPEGISYLRFVDSVINANQAV